jgi:membrane protein DedA with SNARE-associated domain
VIFNAIGAALWVAVWTSIGYVSGNNINTIYNTATSLSTYLAIGLGALVLLQLARVLLRRNARARSKGS